MKTTFTFLKEVKTTALLFLFSMLLMISFWSSAQPCRCGNGGYTNSVYQSVIIASNVQFTQNASANFDGTTEQESMDIWGPVGDNCNKRPVIIWVHGGGFAQNDKSAPDVVAMCDSFSRKGFITATIDYRDDYWGTSGPVNDFSTDPTPYDNHEFTRADYRAMQDAKCAARYLKANASLYGIDTNFIFMGGTSAGAWTSLLVGYLNNPSEKFPSCFQQTLVAGTYQRPDLGSIEGSGGWNNVSSAVTGVISIFGAVPDTAIVDGNNDVPAIFFHEYGDPVVNFYYGPPFQGQYQNFSSYWGDYYVNMQLQNYGETHKAFWINGSQHSLYPYRGLVTTESSIFLDSLICTSPTAVNAIKHDNPIRIYPVPASEKLFVQLDTNRQARICNSLGQQVSYSLLKQGENILDVSSLDQGIYFLTISSGSNIFSQSLIISVH